MKMKKYQGTKIVMATPMSSDAALKKNYKVGNHIGENGYDRKNSMAKTSILAPFILSWEKGYSDRADDPGGPTKYGITLKTWKAYGDDKDKDKNGVIDKYDVMRINKDDFDTIFKKHFWDVCKGDLIKDQSIANIIIDWFYNSGYHAIWNTQALLGLKISNLVGPEMINAINKRNPKDLFVALWKKRKSYLEGLKGFKTNGKGWMHRLNSIGYGKLILNTKGKQTITF
jgi:lysozyme family protein